MKSQNSRNQGFSNYFCFMVEGYGSGRPKNMWIRWIRIRNTENNIVSRAAILQSLAVKIAKFFLHGVKGSLTLFFRQQNQPQSTRTQPARPLRGRSLTTRQIINKVLRARIDCENFCHAAIFSDLKVHKNENFFVFDFEFCPISLLIMHK